jgi:hypothetical protein
MSYLIQVLECTYVENDAALSIVLVLVFGPTLPPDTTDAQFILYIRNFKS